MGDERIMSACWEIWGAIQQAYTGEGYNDKIKSLYDIAQKAMIRAGQINEEVQSND